MIDDILIFDDLFTDEQKDFIENLFLRPRLPWVFYRNVAEGDDSTMQRQPTPGIGCYIKQENPWYLNQLLFKDTRFIIDEATAKIGRVWKYLLNGRAFMLFPLNENYNSEYQSIHVDAKVDHLVCLYYMNDSDGDTFLFDRMYDKNIDGPEKNKDWSVLKRVTPKKGRVLLFNGFRYHTSSLPTKNIRCIINFNLII